MESENPETVVSDAQTSTASTPQQQCIQYVDNSMKQEVITSTPNLQQIISAPIQSPQIISVSPKLQQQIVIAAQQGGQTSSKLQQIITAAIQPQAGMSGSPQIQQIVTSGGQGVIAASQLQQMISGNPQLQQRLMVVTPRFQQAIMTTQLQQTVTTSTQAQQHVSSSPQLQKLVTTSSASTQSQHILGAQHVQKMIPTSSSSTQSIQYVCDSPQPQKVVVSSTTSSQPQQISSSSPQLQKMISAVSTSTQSPLVSSSPQFQKIVATSTTSTQSQVVGPGTQQLQKITTSSSPLLQSVISSTPQLGMKPSAQLLQGVKVATHLQQVVKQQAASQMQQVIKLTPASQPHQVIKSTASSPALQAAKSSTTQQTPQMLQNIKVSTSSQGQQTSKLVPANLPSTFSQASSTTKTYAGPSQNKTPTSPLVQHVIKTAVGGQTQTIRSTVSTQSQQTTKLVTPQTVQTGKSIVVSQMQTAKTQLGSTTPQGVKASPQSNIVQTTQFQQGTPHKTYQNLKTQGVTATPRLQQIVTKKTKEKEPAPPPKPANVGDLIGKLTQGSRHVKRFKEDRRNIMKSVKPLHYGAFGSYAPAYDSSFSNLSKEESDLINGSYDEFEPSPQIKSIISKDYDYTFTLADNLIDILSGESSDAKRIKLEKDVEDEVPDNSTSQESIDRLLPLTAEQEYQTLTGLGLDLTHLKSLEGTSSLSEVGSPDIQQKLEHTTNLITKLQHIQYERLSVPPHPRLGHTIMPPSDSEINLATEITGNLAALTKKVPPGALVLDRVYTLGDNSKMFNSSNVTRP